MASIEIIIKDDKGNVINEGEKRVYNLNLGTKGFSDLKFHDIESSVEELKKNALPDISEDLLKKAQDDYKEEIKKRQCDVQRNEFC